MQELRLPQCWETGAMGWGSGGGQSLELWPPHSALFWRVRCIGFTLWPHRSAYASSLVAQAASAQPLPWGWHALDDFRGVLCHVNIPDLRSIIENKVWNVPIHCCLEFLSGKYVCVLLKYWEDPLWKGTHWKWELGRILILGRDHERGQAVVKELREVTLLSGIWDLSRCITSSTMVF